MCTYLNNCIVISECADAYMEAYISNASFCPHCMSVMVLAFDLGAKVRLLSFRENNFMSSLGSVPAGLLFITYWPKLTYSPFTVLAFNLLGTTWPKPFSKQCVWAK